MLSYYIRAGPKFNESAFLRARKGHMDTKVRRHVKTGRDWRDSAPNLGKPGAAERVEEGLLP